MKRTFPCCCFHTIYCGAISLKTKKSWDDAERYYEMAANDLEIHQARLPAS